MIKIKISLPNSAPPIMRQIPSLSNRWGNCEFFINTSIAECDYWFVLDEIKKEETVMCPSKNVFLITGEPPFVKIYPKKYIDQFSKVFSCQKNLLKRCNSIDSFPPLPWMAGAKLKTTPSGWDQENYLNYDFFRQDRPMNKKNKVVAITSNKRLTKGHKKRLDFILELKSYIPDLIDVFGVGFEKIDDKYNILSQYKYALIIENCEYPNYWTEKLSDSYLSQVFPFYSGCPNLSDYFSTKSFEAIDLNNVLSAKAKIENALSIDLYFQQYSDLICSKQLILDKYNIFAFIFDFVNANEHDFKMHPMCECSVNPLVRDFESKIKLYIAKYFNCEI